jgi:hypothetical protein
VHRARRCGTKFAAPCCSEMRPTGKDVSQREVLSHLCNGAGLGVFLAISLMVGNSTILGAIVHSPYPRLTMLTFVAGVTSLIAIGSAISGFIMTALDKS